MAVVKYNPITPGTRYLVKATKTELTPNVEPERSLLAPHKETAGRNNAGHRTVRYRGGGHKRRYRLVDFKRNKDGIAATVKTVEYDPNRSAFISLVVYADGEKRYIIAPKGIQVGQKIMSGPGAAPEIGNTLLLAEMPLGAVMHNIELNPGRGAAMIRSAGTSATMMGREGIYAVVKLQSGETRRVLLTCRATVGIVSNGEHNLEVMGKAGRNRWKGWRPRNRPVAMNPVDHPMGGGEGRASGGHPRSRKGLIAKGKKTRSKTKPSNALIISRKKSGK